MFSIQMMNHFDTLYNQVWASPYFAKTAYRLNPWGDETLAEFQLYRFNLMRAASMFDPEMRSVYWNHLDHVDRLEAEASYDLYESLTKDIFTAEMLWIREHYLARDLDLLEKPEAFQRVGKQVAATMGESLPPNITHTDWERGMLRFDAAIPLLPSGTPWMQRYEHSFLEPGKYEVKDLGLVMKPQAGFYRSWRQAAGPYQMNVHLSAGLWAYDMTYHSLRANHLKGVPGKRHTLFVNHHIPIPNRATFLSWAHACVLGMDRLTPEQTAALTRLARFPPKLLLTYLLPCLPRTKEHVSRSLVGTDDSHWDHSLPAKSSGHSRDKHGNIDYGQWLVRTVLIGGTQDDLWTYTVANELPDTLSTAAVGFSMRHRHMLPRQSPSAEMFDGLFHRTHSHLINTMMQDPYQAGGDPLSIRWPYMRTADTGMRAISKQLGLHFRFDSDAEGYDASSHWSLAFERCALWHMDASQTDRNRANFTAIMGLTGIPSKLVLDKGEKRTGPDSKVKINLDSLKDIL